MPPRKSPRLALKEKEEEEIIEAFTKSLKGNTKKDSNSQNKKKKLTDSKSKTEKAKKSSNDQTKEVKEKTKTKPGRKPSKVEEKKSSKTDTKKEAQIESTAAAENDKIEKNVKKDSSSKIDSSAKKDKNRRVTENKRTETETKRNRNVQKTDIKETLSSKKQGKNVKSKSMKDKIEKTKQNEKEPIRKTKKKAPRQNQPLSTLESDASLEKCLDKLNIDTGTIPLPGREEKIEQVSAFIEEALNSQQFKILYISGSPGTGKTATIKHCINIASQPHHIDFVNCKTSKPTLITPDDTPPRLLVLDEVETLNNYQDIVTNCKRYNCSILCISNAHDRTISISKAHSSEQSSIMFDSYTPNQLMNILIERTGGPNKNIQQAAIQYIANKVGQGHGDARTIINTMNYILTEAIRQGITELDVPTVVKMINNQKTPDPVNDILNELPIKEQIALVAIFRAGNNWMKEFAILANQKKIPPVPPSTLIEFFDRLTSYCVVSGSYKSPKCRVTKEQLTNGLNEIVTVLL